MPYKDKERAVKAQNEWARGAFDHIHFTVPKGERERIRAAAAAQEESVNAYIRRAIEEQMERDKPAMWIDDGPDLKCPRCGGMVDGEAYFLLDDKDVKYCPYCGVRVEENSNGTD